MTARKEEVDLQGEKTHVNPELYTSRAEIQERGCDKNSAASIGDQPRDEGGGDFAVGECSDIMKFIEKR